MKFNYHFLFTNSLWFLIEVLMSTWIIVSALNRRKIVEVMLFMSSWLMNTSLKLRRMSIMFAKISWVIWTIIFFPALKDLNSKFFYLKMKGNYHHYLAEFFYGDTNKNTANSAYEAYKKASNIDQINLFFIHPIFLGHS